MFSSTSIHGLPISVFRHARKVDSTASSGRDHLRSSSEDLRIGSEPSEFGSHPASGVPVGNIDRCTIFDSKKTHGLYRGDGFLNRVVYGRLRNETVSGLYVVAAQDPDPMLSQRTPNVDLRFERILAREELQSVR